MGLRTSIAHICYKNTAHNTYDQMKIRWETHLNCVCIIIFLNTWFGKSERACVHRIVYIKAQHSTESMVFTCEWVVSLGKSVEEYQAWMFILRSPSSETRNSLLYAFTRLPASRLLLSELLFGCRRLRWASDSLQHTPRLNIVNSVFLNSWGKHSASAHSASSARHKRDLMWMHEQMCEAFEMAFESQQERSATQPSAFVSCCEAFQIPDLPCPGLNGWKVNYGCGDLPG